MAPEISAPLKRHWYELAPLAVTLRTAFDPGATVMLCGAAEMIGNVSANSVALEKRQRMGRLIVVIRRKSLCNPPDLISKVWQVQEKTPSTNLKSRTHLPLDAPSMRAMDRKRQVMTKGKAKMRQVDLPPQESCGFSGFHSSWFPKTPQSRRGIFHLVTRVTVSFFGLWPQARDGNRSRLSRAGVST